MAEDSSGESDGSVKWGGIDSDIQELEMATRAIKNLDMISAQILCIGIRRINMCQEIVHKVVLKFADRSKA